MVGQLLEWADLATLWMGPGFPVTEGFTILVQTILCSFSVVAPKRNTHCTLQVGRTFKYILSTQSRELDIFSPLYHVVSRSRARQPRFA